MSWSRPSSDVRYGVVTGSAMMDLQFDGLRVPGIQAGQASTYACDKRHNTYLLQSPNSGGIPDSIGHTISGDINVSEVGPSEIVPHFLFYAVFHRGFIRNLTSPTSPTLIYPGYVHFGLTSSLQSTSNGLAVGITINNRDSGLSPYLASQRENICSVGGSIVKNNTGTTFIFGPDTTPSLPATKISGSCCQPVYPYRTTDPLVYGESNPVGTVGDLIGDMVVEYDLSIGYVGMTQDDVSALASPAPPSGAIVENNFRGGCCD